jgi:intraflagellar transport protein 88
MEFSPKHEVGFNLVLCYYATGDIIKAKEGFAKLSSIAEVRFLKSDSPQVDSLVSKFNEADDRDEFAHFINAKRKEAIHYLFNAARLIAPILDTDKWESGYRWVTNQVCKKGNTQVANQLEIEQALAHLRRNEASLAIELLKSFESKNLASKTMAATNLSSIYFLERHYKSVHSFADMAVSNSRYNAQAYVNKGNCLFADGDHAGAREMYIEAIGTNSGCVDAIFNLGLVCLQLDQEKDAMTLFERIQLSTPGNPSVLYQLANICEKPLSSTKLRSGLLY